MKRRILLSFVFILASLASWGWAVNAVVTDTSKPGFKFQIVTVDETNKVYTVRVYSLDTGSSGTGNTNVTVPATITAVQSGGQQGSGTSMTVLYSGKTGIYTNCTEVTFSEGITTIEAGCFNGCANLVQVNLPSTLTTWDENSLHEGGVTKNMAKFTFYNTTSSDYTATGNDYFSLNSDGNALMSKNGSILWCILSNKLDGSKVTPLTVIDVPSSVEYIAFNGDKMFGANCNTAASTYQATNMVTTVNLPASFKGGISGSTTSVSLAKTTFSCIANHIRAINVPADNATYANNKNHTVSAYSNNSGDGILYYKDLTTLVAYPQAHCSSAETYTVADEVTTILSGAAYKAIEKGLNLNQATTVQEMAFESNDNLTTVNIGPNLVHVISTSFTGCGNLAEINVDAGNPYYASTNGVLYGCGETDADRVDASASNTNLKYTHLMTCPGAYDNTHKTYDVDERTKIIDASAFKDLQLTTITLHEGITTLGQSAFHGCYIESMVIPNSVTTAGSGTFTSSHLKKVTVGTGLATISSQMFAYTSQLDSIKFATPSKVTTVEGSAFAGTKLASITFPATVTTMGATVFGDNAKTTTVTFVNDSKLTEITNTFKESKIVTVDFGSNSSLTSIGNRAFYKSESLTTILNYPAGVTSIGESAFAYCTALTSFPFAENNSGLKTIGNNAFQECGVTDFNLPEGLETIGKEAFLNCTHLTQLEIPSTVSSIGLKFTMSCDALTKINVSRNNAKFSSSDGILCSKDKKTLIVFPGGKDRNTFTLLPPSITTIQQYAFYACTQLQYLVLPKKLSKIENFAFQCCDNLKTITFLGDTKPADVDTDVINDNKQTNVNNQDHRFGNTNTSAVDFLKNNVTVNIRKNENTVSSFADSYWANAKSQVVSFDVSNGQKQDGNSYEYLFMTDNILGVVKSNSTNYTAVVPDSVVWSSDGISHPVRVIADYAFEDIPSTVNEMVFLGPIKYVGANAFNTGHYKKNTDDTIDESQNTAPTSSIQNIFFTSNDDTDDNKMELSSVKFELNGMSLSTEDNNYDWGTENYSEFLKAGTYTTAGTQVDENKRTVTVAGTQNVYVPKSRLAAILALWSNKDEDGTASSSATNAATIVDYKVPLPAISKSYGTFSREFDVDLKDLEDNTSSVTFDDDAIVAYTGKIKDFKGNDNNVIAIRMLSINCNDHTTKGKQTNAGDGTFIPANTGVLLRAYGTTSPSGAYYRIGEKSHDYTSDFAKETKYTNVFLPVVENGFTLSPTETISGVTYTNYIIANGGYMSLKENVTAPVHKAYMHIGTNYPAGESGSAKAIQFFWDDEDTAINDIYADTDNEKKVIYDLSGRRVNNASAKGMYIVNGKKMMVK